ncbi:MAG: hypothetical protein LAT62_11110 [Natronospirillum sp.]|uniref:hypothetical protein n=1 Tax=Natronospirillum sp. TaxID=2812955 RepID=UPI0025DC8286|nr:hypothetical protein [Natronospirillum sp.]MCH8552478.1 hypothetical protein [Natronospirillum sp.]
MYKYINGLLAGLGHRAALVFPACIVIGLVFPPVAGALQNWLYPAFVIPLMISIARLEWSGQWLMLKRWRLMVLLSVWTLVASPILVWLVIQPLAVSEDLSIALVLAAAAPPLTACGAIALLLRIDGNLAVVGTLLTLLLCPITLPPVALLLLGIELDIALGEFMFRLAAIVGLAFGGAFLLKRWRGQAHIDHHADLFDGIAVLFIGLFIIGIMDGITDLLLRDPWQVLMALGAATVLVFGLNFLSSLLFWTLQRRTALAVGLVSGQVNLGLIYIALYDQLSLETLAVFAIGQIPLYLLPAIAQPIARRLL